MQAIAQVFLGLWGAASVVEVLAHALGAPEWVHFISKPMVVLGLGLYFYLHTQLAPSRLRNLMLLALLLGWLGDMALLLVPLAPDMFVLGLVCFLVGHVVYVLVFREQWPAAWRANLKRLAAFWVFVIALAVVLVAYLWPLLGSLRIPVAAYAVVLAGMSLAASLRLGGVSSHSYSWVLAGAVLFMLSDSLLAINKFGSPLPLAGALIMGTYCLAQFAIVRGMLLSLVPQAFGTGQA